MSTASTSTIAAITPDNTAAQHDGNALADMVSPPREAVAIYYAVEGGDPLPGVCVDGEGYAMLDGGCAVSRAVEA